MTPTRAQGVHGSGGVAYTPQDIQRVYAVLRAAPNGRTVEQLAQATGLGGRTIRSLLSHEDGRSFLRAGGDEGYALAAVPDEAEPFTRRLASQVGTMAARVDRRRSFAAGMERRQLALPLEAA